MGDSEDCSKEAILKRISKVLNHLAAKKTCSHHKQVCTTKNALKTKQCSHTCEHRTGDSSLVDIEDLHKIKHSGDFLDNDCDRLFDAARFAETQKPLLQASTLPRECYNSRKWFERELQRVFLQSWILMGREDEIQNAGDYLAEDTAWSGPIAVCRDTQGEIHAFANVCCHRGAKILKDGPGQASSIGLVCPYHAWTYDFDGTLTWAPAMEETQNFDEDNIRLKPLLVEKWCGFIFVSPLPKPRSLMEILGDLPEKLPEWFGSGGMAENSKCCARKEYIVDCNWKFLMENTCETYHTSVVHKDSLGPMKASPLPPHIGDWDAVVVPTSRSVVPLPSDFKGQTEILPIWNNRTSFVNLFPALQINVTWDCFWW